MKTRIKNLLLLPALIAGMGLMLAGRVTAQTITNLHSFTATFSFLNGFYTNSGFTVFRRNKPSHENAH